MIVENSQETARRLPKGFVHGCGGPASEHARTMGWEIYEDARGHSAEEKQAASGGVDSGPANLGGEAKNTTTPVPKKIADRPALGRAPTQNPVVVKRTQKAA